MTRGLIAKLVLSGLVVLACVDAAQAGLIFGRRKRGNDCCCEGGYSGGGYGYSRSGSGYGGYAYAPMYGNSYACGGQQGGSYGGYASYPMPMGGGYVMGTGEPNMFLNITSSTNTQLTAEKARLRIQVPTADARLWVNNQMIQMGGTDRSLDITLGNAVQTQSNYPPTTPPVPNQQVNPQPQKFTITAQWVKDGREVVRKKEVEVKAGQESTVTFSDNEALAPDQNGNGNTEQIQTNPNALPPNPNGTTPKPDKP